MNSIFVMSSERSGSNLLRKMLGMHSTVSAPPPPHMWRHLSPNVHHYGSLKVDDNIRTLILDALSMTQVPDSHLHWDCDISLDEVLMRLKANNLTGVIAAIYEVYAAKQGATTWVCKENNLFEYAFQIRNVLPNAKFIYLCRDGRDVACSIKKIPSHDQHIWFIAKEWHAEQMQCLLVYQELIAQNDSIIVRYEDLISNAENELRRICDFVNLAYESQMLEFYKGSDLRAEASKTKYWKNLTQPVMTNNKAKFFNELSVNEIDLFEMVAAGILKVLGYPLVGQNESRRIGRGTVLFYYILNKVQTYLQKRKMLEEPGRLERQMMLKNLYGKKSDVKKAFAPLIRYE